MKNLFLVLALLVAVVCIGQTKYYAKINKTVTEYGKTKKVVTVVSITIDEEGKTVSINTGEPALYRITGIAPVDSETNTATLKLLHGENALQDSRVTYTKTQAIYFIEGKSTIFTLERPSISIK